MSKQNRTQGRKKAPVSSHPLFPAIVALWFGALFGLGSLAVRPSLLESLVLSSHLDVILPMTAPPLGMTARILLALTMAVIGVAAGAIIARRIARPKPVARQRRRNTAASADKPRGFGATTLSEPLPSQPEPQAAPESVLSGRRRSLTVEEEEREDYRLRAAPLPGGAPEIFDVTQIDMTEPVAAAPVADPEPVAEAQPLELGGYAQPDQSVVAQSYHNVLAKADVAEDQAPDCLDLNEAAAMPEHRQIFGQKQADPAPPAAFAAPESPPETGQSFAAPAPAAEPIQDVPTMTAFNPQPSPRRFDSPAEPAPFSAPASLAVADTPVASAPAVPAVESEAAPQASLDLPQDSAAQRIATANLAELSPVELIERFALALQQRRSSGAIPAGLVEAAASFAAPEAVQIPEAYVAPASLAPFTAPAAAPTAAIAPEPAPAPAPEAVFKPVVEPGDAPQQPRIPSAFTAPEVIEALQAPAPSPLTLPAALRPIDFSDFEDQDDSQDHVLARSIAMSAPAPETILELSEPLIADAPAEPVAATVGEVEPEPDVLEEGYSSLLDLNRPAPLRQTFVRIEEAMAESAPIEPVVIFPGQDARAGMRFARPTEQAAPSEFQPAPAPPEAFTAPAEGASNVRRFDAPGAAGPAAAPASPAQDPAEAERALRSALATLQRMSGAA